MAAAAAVEQVVSIRLRLGVAHFDQMMIEHPAITAAAAAAAAGLMRLQHTVV